jgi:hypothetical protein
LNLLASAALRYRERLGAGRPRVGDDRLPRSPDGLISPVWVNEDHAPDHGTDAARPLVIDVDATLITAHRTGIGTGS